MDSMFQTLMQMPLFHGVSYNKLSEILGKHRFHFLKYTDNERIISAGDLCTHLSTVVSGKVRMTISNADGHVKVSQTLTYRPGLLLRAHHPLSGISHRYRLMRNNAN